MKRVWAGKIWKNLRQERGYSLFGVLLAFFILGVALISFLNLMIASVQTTTLANGISIASNLAQKEIELLRTYGYDHWYKALDDNDDLPITMTDTVHVQGVKFIKTSTVSFSPLQKETIQIEVRVKYIDVQNVEHQVFLTSLLGNYE